MGFGQVHIRSHRRHLSRLAVVPKYRGKGLGKKLVASIISIEKSKVDGEFSLFVYRNNRIARKCYERLGFIETNVPEDQAELEGCVYMVLNPRGED